MAARSNIEYSKKLQELGISDETEQGGLLSYMFSLAEIVINCTKAKPEWI